MKKRLSSKRSVSINGHSTSVTLEDAFWAALKEISEVRRLSMSAIIADIDRRQPENLSSAIRVFVLEHYKSGGHPSH